MPTSDDATPQEPTVPAFASPAAEPAEAPVAETADAPADEAPAKVKVQLDPDFTPAGDEEAPKEVTVTVPGFESRTLTSKAVEVDADEANALLVSPAVKVAD